MNEAQVLRMPGIPDPEATPSLSHVEDSESWSDQVGQVLEFLRRRALGDYEVDEFGFDPDLADNVLFALLRPLYSRWFRVEVRGIQNIPADGPALVVSNHAGSVALDAAMVQLAILDHHPAARRLRPLGTELVFDLPWVGMYARKMGATLACNEDAERLLRQGELVGVWPEGSAGSGKRFSERYRLQRFGRGGFVSAALKTGAPIVPCSVVGSEETYPMLGNVRLLARLLGLPYFPLTPTFPWLGLFGVIPLPSKWIIEFGEPIESSATVGTDDPMLVFEATDMVRERIQHNLYRMLVRRRGVFR
jgi:1-acyl-sn-glycerol-3-phosphate acyltransferase